MSAADFADCTLYGTWVRAWAIAHGRDPSATYETARATVARRLQRGLPPQGAVGIAMIDALRKQLGGDVVPHHGTDEKAPPC
jgi:hypothetical protein